MDETSGASLKGGLRESQVQVQAKDEARDVRVEILYVPYAPGEISRTPYVDYGAGWEVGRCLRPKVDRCMSFQGTRESGRYYRIGRVDPHEAERPHYTCCALLRYAWLVANIGRSR